MSKFVSPTFEQVKSGFPINLEYVVTFEKYSCETDMYYCIIFRLIEGREHRWIYECPTHRDTDYDRIVGLLG